MACSNCKKTEKCSCNKTTEFVKPPSECNTQDCPTPNPCPEITGLDCIVNLGEDILCGEDTVVSTGDSQDTINRSIISYFCERIASILNSCVELFTVRQLQGCDDGPIEVLSDITFEPLPLPTLSAKTDFAKTDYGSEVDVIIPGVLEITRGDNQGIYNSAVELSYINPTSPGNTEWASLATDGSFDYLNVENYQDLTYNTWVNARDWTQDPNYGIVGVEMIMRETTTNRYFYVKFLTWTPNNAGGGFTYERYEVLPTTEELKKFTFSDGTIQDEAAGRVTSDDTSVVITETITPENKRVWDLSVPTPEINIYAGQTAYVDAKYGNDGTAQVNNFGKPYLTIQAAQSALEGSLLSGTEVGLVYVRAGAYSPGYIYHSISREINYHFEDGCVITNSYWRSFGTFKSSITGQGIFINDNTLQFINHNYQNTRLIFKCKEHTHTSSSTAGFADMLVNGNAPANIFGPTDRTYFNFEAERLRLETPNNVSQVYLLRADDIAVWHFRVKRLEVKSNGALFLNRNNSGVSTVKTMFVEIDDLIWESYYDGTAGTQGMYGMLVTAENFVTGTVSGIPSNLSHYKVKSTIIDFKENAPIAFFCPFTIAGGANEIVWEGDIELRGTYYTNSIVTMYNSVSTVDTILTLKGNIVNLLPTGTTILITQTNGAVVLQETNLLCPNSTGNNAFDIQGKAFTLLNSNVEVSSAVATISTNNIANIDIFGSTVKDTGAATDVIVSTAPTNTPYFKDFVTNKTVGANVTPLSPVGGITVDTNLRIPKFKI